MLQLMNVIDSEIFNAQYEVYINGSKADCIKARVSAMPYNTVWPGYQRPMEQTELTSIVSFAGDEETVISVRPLKVRVDETTDIQIRPLSKQIQYHVENGRIVFALKEHGSYSLELNGFHEVLTIMFNPIRDFLAEAEKCRQEQGTLLYYPEGIHHIGKVELESHTTVVIDSGAVLYGSFNATCAEDIKICGYGILDGSMEERQTESNVVLHDYYSIIPTAKEEIQRRYKEQKVLDGCLRFFRCHNISVEGVILRDSSNWCFSVSGSDNVLIDNIKLVGMWRYNSDGIDVVNCSNIVIRKSFLRNFDDCIVIKGITGWENRNNENILVENCVLWCDWGRNLEIGAETCAPEYRNIIMKDCDLIHGSTVFMDIQHHNEAEIHHVIFENINAEYTKYQLPDTYQADMQKPFHAEQNTKHPVLMGIFMMNTDYFSKKNLHGSAHDIVFKNINVYKDEEVLMPESCFSGFEGHRVSDITIDGLYVNSKKINTMEEGRIYINEFTDNVNIL